jgi:hypothetical protein
MYKHTVGIHVSAKTNWTEICSLALSVETTLQAAWLLGVYLRRISVLVTLGYHTKLEKIIYFSKIFYKGLGFLYLWSTALDKITGTIDYWILYVQKSKYAY